MTKRFDDQARSDLLDHFRDRPARRAILQGLVAAGAAGSSLLSFADALAAAGDEDVKQITVLSQPGVVPDILRDVTVPMFRKDHPGTDVQIEVSLNAVSYPRMLAQRSNPVISGGMINDLYTQKGVGDGMWAKLDPAFVPNTKNVPPDLMTKGGFGAPLHLSPVGIMYNPDRVEEPTSWLDLWNPKYKGRVSMWDIWHDPYAMFGVATGKGPSIEEGIKAWAPHRDQVGSWTNNTTTEEELVHRGEMWLAPHWGAWTEQAKSQGKRVAFTIPKEGGVQWTAHIQSTAGFSPKVTELTQRYLNTWLSDECQKAWIERGFFSPSTSTVQVPAAMKDNKAILSPEDAVKRLVRLDYDDMSANQQRYRTLIQRTLKA